MFHFLKKSLQNKIFFSTSLISILAIISLVVFYHFKLKTYRFELHELNTHHVVQELANNINKEVDNNVEIMVNLSNLISNFAVENMNEPRQMQSKEILRNILNNNPSINSVFLVWLNETATVDSGAGNNQQSQITFSPLYVKNADDINEHILSNFLPSQIEYYDWFTIPKEKRTKIILWKDLGVSKFSNEKYLVVVPIIYNKQFYGVVGAQFATKIVQNIKDFTYQYNANIDLVSEENILLYSNVLQNKIGQSYSNDEVAITRQRNDTLTEMVNNEIRILYPISNKQLNTKWILKINLPIINLYATNNISYWYDIFLVIIIFILVILFVNILLNHLFAPLKNIVENISDISNGIFSGRKLRYTENEIGKISSAINQLQTNMLNITMFAKELENENYDTQFEKISQNDDLGKSLMQMRYNLKTAKEQSIKQQKDNEIRNWINQGVATFGDILRQNISDMDSLTYKLISKIVEYVKANIGGFFLINTNDPNNVFIELKAAYAYDKYRYQKKSYKIGEGLVGICAIEKQIIMLDELPADYLKLASGLGEAPPQNLILVPMQSENKIVGIIEIAAIRKFSEHEIKFLVEIADDIASTINNLKANLITAELLKRAQEQSEEMASQEEEMRQNLEELQATQEEALRKDFEMQGLLYALNTSTFTMEYDIHGQIIDLNDSFAKLYGKPREYLIGLFHKDGMDLSKFTKNEYNTFWKELRNGKGKKEITKFLYNGKTIWLSEHYTPLRDERGEVYKILKIAVDITESQIQSLELDKKQIEIIENEKELKHKVAELEKLREDYAAKQYETEQMLEALDQQLIVAQFTTDGIVIKTNNRFKEQFNIAASLTRNTIFDIYGEGEIKKVKNILTLLAEGTSYRNDDVLTLPSNVKQWFKVSYVPFYDKNKTFAKIFFFAQNIQKSIQEKADINSKIASLQKTEAILNEKVEKLTNINSTILEKQSELDIFIYNLAEICMIIELDTEGKIVNINNLFANYFCESSDSIIGNYIGSLIHFPTEEYNLLLHNLLTVNKHKVTSHFELNNETYWLDLSFSAIKKNSEIRKIVAIGFDITQNKKNEILIVQKDENIEKNNQKINQIEEEYFSNKNEIIEQLNNINNKFHNINSVISICELDKDGKIINVNSVFENNYNVVENNIIGISFTSILSTTAGKTFNSKMLDMYKGKSIHLENKIYYKGEVITTLETCVPILNENNKLIGINVYGVCLNS